MSLISFIQIAVSVLLIGVILVQERSSGAGGLFGGGEGTFYQARRGVEKTIFIATLVLLGIFAAVSLLNLIA
jgi:preprotein translocase subunit SecG